MPEDIEYNLRYLEIKAIASHDAYQIMEDFVDELDDSPEAEALQAALNGLEPFRCFKGTGLEYPELRDRGLVFKEVRLNRFAQAWCDEQGIAVA